MGKKYAMIGFGILTALLFLQISCAGMKEQPAEDVPAVAEVAAEVAAEVVAEAVVEAAELLVDTHKSAGISCTDCHLEMPLSGAIPEDTCLGCHEDYQESTAGTYGDPHNAHVGYPDCVSCHHFHKPSENQCLACHAF